MPELRPYQNDAIEAITAYWARGGGNPLVEMATGTGKSLVIGELARQLLAGYPDMQVLMLVHVRELVEQNAVALLRAWPEAPLGIWCAGLGRRERRQIIYASIQSVHRQDAYSLGPRDLVLIDEAHLVPAAGDGMYRKLLERLRERRLDMRVAGFTATPYRLDSGRLDDGRGRLFDEIVYSYGIRPAIDAGFLAPLISKATIARMDGSGVAKRGGEFVPAALEAAADQNPLVRAAVAEIADLGAERRSWLLFCAGVQHAHHVAEAIRAIGVSCATITAETPSGDRARIIADFKAGRLRALTNANVLTTGFDAPGTDLIAMLRATLSTGLYVQMVGRGTRPAEGKSDCLVLDFAGNVRRHGPVDVVEIKATAAAGEKVGAVKEDTFRAKECPTCHAYSPIAAGSCKWCGHEWPIEVKAPHDREADGETPILSDGPRLSRTAKKLLPEDQPVMTWDPRRHSKEGAPDSVRVIYLAGLMTFSEWVCPAHAGFAGAKAARWWREHGGANPPPADATQALARWGELTAPEIIQTRRSGQWWEIVGRRFASAPAEAA